MYRVEMFPAREGDCVVLTYGSADAPRRVMVDGGRTATYGDLKAHLEQLPAAQREFELLIVTHIDRDHIQGVLEMLEDEELPVSFKDVWFNGYHHLMDGDFEEFSAKEGERLTASLIKLVEEGKCTWNGSFGDGYKKAAALPKDETLLEVELEDGLTLTLLSPTRKKMEEMQGCWAKECEKAGLVAGYGAQDPPPEGFEHLAAINIGQLAEEPFEEDDSDPNGCSIAVMAQYNDKRVLLTGDAHPTLLEDSLSRFGDTDDPVEFAAFKLPHHGSRKNISKELLQAIDCKRYLISTNGSYFDHPDPVAMSRVIKYGGGDKEIWFNYRSVETEVWDVPSWKADFHYSVHYPDSATNGYQSVDLE